MTVTALLVSHDGARWLPGVLAALDRQSVRPDRVVAVDTGSEDTSRDLLTAAVGPQSVLLAPTGASFDQAVRTGLEHLDQFDRPEDQDSAEDDWVWLLHDDSAPDDRALEHLLAAARDSGAAVLGPKLREWPSLRRLLEVGVTLSGTGRRETGLERGEYDQGQHDRPRDVLAVNTAGMLVRRDVLTTLGGFDRRLPFLGNDVDFGWRAARAGHRVRVVPEAVVFHVEAAGRGIRRTPGPGSTARKARMAALYTLLVNCSALAMPFVLVRLSLGTVLRALGLLLVRAPREAADEVAALALTLLHPLRVLSGRRHRRATATVPHQEVRHLLAPFWLPYRHGLDLLTDLAVAVASQGRDVRARRAARVPVGETGPVPDEAENLPPDTGLLSRLLSSPVAAVFLLLFVLGLWSARHVLGTGTLWGGSLLPVPSSAMDWWGTYLASGHPGGTPTAAPAPAYLLPMAVLGTLFLGKAWLVVDLLFVLAVPLSALTAYRFLKTLTGNPWSPLWGAATYGLVAALSGAVGQGRLGTVVGLVLLPLVARSLRDLAPDRDPERRTRAGWRAGLWLALLAAFVPTAWLLAAALVAVTVFTGWVFGGPEWRRLATARPLLVALLAPLVLLLPWTWQVFTDGDPHSLLLEAGLPLGGLTLGWAQVVAGRLGVVADAPAWLGVGTALAGVAALLRRERRSMVLLAWAVAVVSLALTAGLLRVPVGLPGAPAAVAPYQGFLMLVLQAALITAAVVASDGISAEFSASSFGWRQPVAGLVLVVAVLSPVAGLLWWVGSGIDGPIDRQRVSAVPVFMAEQARTDPTRGVLVLSGDVDTGLGYSVYRGDGPRLGDESTALATSPDLGLARLVRVLVSDPTDDAVKALAAHGVGYVLAPGPASLTVAGVLDTASGLTNASAGGVGARAWEVDAPRSRVAAAQPTSPVRPWLLAAQFLALVTAFVLAAPSRRSER